MKLAWRLKYGVLYSIYSVVVKDSKVMVMVGQNRYFKLRIPSQLHTANSLHLLYPCKTYDPRFVTFRAYAKSEGPDQSDHWIP